jgi:hypothetical protein
MWLYKLLSFSSCQALKIQEQYKYLHLLLLAKYVAWNSRCIGLRRFLLHFHPRLLAIGSEAQLYLPLPNACVKWKYATR